MGPLRSETTPAADSSRTVRTGSGSDGIPPVPVGPNGDGRRRGEPLSRQPNNAVVGLWLYLASATMFFVGLVGAFLVSRAGVKEWWPASLGPVSSQLLLNTIILLASSVTMAWAQGLARRGHRFGLLAGVGLTLLLGTVFLGWQIRIWRELVEVGVTTGLLFGANFYLMSGAHALHILGGLVFLAIVWARAWQGRYTPERHLGVRLCAVYWHFVDLVWLALYGLLFLWR